jgi:hypothetical protein
MTLQLDTSSRARQRFSLRSTLLQWMGATGALSLVKRQGRGQLRPSHGVGPSVLIRTELDGLPIEEMTDLPYSSKARATWNSESVSVMRSSATIFTWPSGWASPAPWSP